MVLLVLNAWHRLTISAIALSVVFLGVVYRQPASAIAIPDSAEAREVMAAVQSAYDAIALAHTTENPDKLATAIIDHPDYWNNLDTERQNSVRQYTAEILGAAIPGQGGYLTAMKAKIMHKLAGEKLLKAAMSKASAEKRDLTIVEQQALADPNHGVVPSLRNSDLPRRVINKWLTITIDGDKARAVYDTGIVTRTAILVRIDGHWYVAGIF